MSTRIQVLLSLAIVIGAAVVVVIQLRGGGGDPIQSEEGGHDHAAVTAAGELRPVTLDPEMSRRIGLAFSTAERRVLPVRVRTVGTVTYDETRLATVNPKIEGWVERLHVDFTGAPVRAGQPLMEIYSPMLVTAQEELVLAGRLLRDATSERARRNAEELLASARRRLSYWDIGDDEIRRIEERGGTARTLTIRSPASGIVVEKSVVQGDRIMPGMTVYRIADLGRVWIDAEVFEKDLSLVAVGRRATVSFEAYPGRSFEGRVTYVYPTVSVQSRTGRARIELPNSDQALKPGMYAHIELESPPAQPTLVIPRSAIIETGERILVFVRAPTGALVPREITAGRASGSFLEVLAGLDEGEQVVSSAAFLIDAESNLGTMTGEMAAAAAGAQPADTSGHREHEE